MQTVRARLGRAFLASAILGSLLLGRSAGRAAAATCLPTGALDRDGTPLTARIINPAGPVSGRVDATGCEVGVYFGRGSGVVSGAEVFGARYYGVLVDGNLTDVSVDVSNSTIHDIGETPRTAVRHGQGVAYRSFDGGSATGTISGNRVWAFQEAGLNVTGPGSTVTVSGNRVIGPGPEAVIAENGIQVIFGGHGTVLNNTISDMSYTGPLATGSTGVLVAGGPIYGKPYTVGAVIVGNVITGSDNGVVVYEAEVNDRPSPLPTSTRIESNVISNDHLNNVSGSGQKGYQAGILVHANGDRIVGNTISGDGYDKTFCGGSAVCLPIDTKHTIDPIVSGNILQ
jgi:parallel beta helix pectate lyase-like protein